ncbi:hypothetical protein OIU76_027176 [Salix suchowensis]|nr:hypothetical protein OIU76_027176 [Salix suchowensis]
MHVKFSERSSSNNHQHFVYSRRKLQGNCIDFLPAITNRCGEDSPFVVNSDDPSVAVTEHLIVSEDEIESDAVREPMIRPVVCNGAEYSHPLCFGRGHAPSMPNISGDEYLSLISSDDPSAAEEGSCQEILESQRTGEDAFRLSFSAPFHLVLSSICNGDLEFVEPNMVAILEVDL